MSHLTQMAGLAVQNFVSAAVGLCCRGGADPRPRAAEVGHDRELLGRPHPRHDPAAAAARRLLRARPRRARASSRTSTASRRARRCRARRRRSRAARWRARRRSRRSARTAAASTTPTRPIRSRTRTGSPLARDLLLLADPVRADYTYGRLVEDQRQGWVLFAVMFVDLDRGGRARDALRDGGEPEGSGPRRTVGGNIEGKEVRFGTVGIAASSQHRRRERRPARSTRRTTASRRSAARCRWST